MRRIFFALILLCWFLLGTDVVAQSSVPTDTITSPTLHVYSRMVLLDVTVTDAKGKPIHGLSPSDFHISDNNRPQKISSFEEHDTDQKTPYQPAIRDLGTYSNDGIIHPPPVFNLILIDTNTIDLPEQMYLSDQLNRFIDQLPATQPIAIYDRWGDRAMLLQDFTAEHIPLLKAVRKAIPHSTLPGSSTYSDFDTLNQILAYIGNIPGRKNVLWFTGRSTLSLEPRAGGVPWADRMQRDEDLRDIYDKLEAARISLYPIDANGLVYVPANSEGRKTVLDQKGIAGIFDQHSLMSNMAAATGGKAYYNDNGLSQVLSQVVTNDASYYTLTFSPDDLHLDNRWHRLKLKVDQPYELSFRQGYFDDGINNAAGTPKRGMRTLLRSNSRTELVPDNHSEPIIFEAKVLPASDLPRPMVGQKNNPPNRPARRGEVTYTIHYTVPLDAFLQEAKGPNGTLKVGAAVMSFNQYGSRVGWLSQSFHLSFSKITAAGADRRIAFDQSVNLPKGDDSLYLAIWDVSTGRLGGMEIPLTVRANR